MNRTWRLHSINWITELLDSQIAMLGVMAVNTQTGYHPDGLVVKANNRVTDSNQDIAL